ncbi:glycosyltransferase family 2 protein [Atopobium sp. oral taxon 810]|uniref:glycosyltransferase family 2 protein n=1 Tax=Atopobium sp. oral taxon 810 TaxID=712158 RepID=UPI0003960617|nr:glycosyltransferase family 2 protein [Atopobium sp. oral taxon 810]ERI04549.1 glycosyltransferase, group 2 family protein [Atopobium sp. oral taxon 810 str. F0209]
MKILAIIPAYNEEDCLETTVKEFEEVCPNVDYLVINDGSKDHTPEICDELGLNHIDMPINTGLASGFRAGMKYALKHHYDAVVQFDSDGQHIPSYIPLMAKKLEETGCDIVLGSRYLAGEKAAGLRNVGSRIISHMIRMATHITITDPTCGLRMYGKQMIPLFAKGFDLEPEPDTMALLLRNGVTVCEIPISIRQRQGGTSYLNPFRASRYMLRTLASLVLFVWFR